MSDQPAHPNGPRTLGTQLRDNAPMPRPVLERLLALESGRHPTLSELRAALGLDLDVYDTWDDARPILRAFRAQIPSDEELAHLIDTLYRGIRSSRLVRVEITDGGPEADRDGGAIRVREGEHLRLLVLADNRTATGMEFSAESHGEGLGGWVEANRAGSGLLDCAAMPAGSFLLPVLIAAGGRTTTLDVPIECAPSGTLRVRITDAATSSMIPARVYLTDDVGPAWPDGAQIRKDTHGNAWFHADGSFEVRISGTAKLRIVRGIEYEPFEIDVTVPNDGEASAEARLQRWSHMAADGWYSGDVHVHLHYGGEYLLEPADASLAQRAEDVHFMNMMVANQGSYWVHDEGHFSGADHELSDSEHILRWGEEYRNDFYGHMCMYGISRLVPPIYSGFLQSDHVHDLPSNAVAARHCHEAGGTLSYAHPLFDSVDLDRVFALEWRRSVEAKELPVDAALGLIDAIDVLSYPSRNIEVARLWYKLLNCGLRLAATAGTDTFMNTCDQDHFSNAPAGCRAFVRVDGALSTESWCAGVRAGRTFVTNGPMITLSVGEHAIGDEITAKRGDVLHIEASAGAIVPMQRIHIIVNGESVASSDATDGGRAAAVAHDLTIDGSCWIAARVMGHTHDLVLDSNGVFAHTSPIFVSVDSAPTRVSGDAAYFVEWIERLIALAMEKGRYPSDKERAEVLAVFREGQAYYKNLLG